MASGRSGLSGPTGRRQRLNRRFGRIHSPDCPRGPDCPDATGSYHANFPKDGRSKWQRERAKELGFTGKETRSLRELIAAAEMLEAARTDKNGLARNVPMEIVKRPWAQVKKAIKVFRETGKVEGKMPPKPVTPDMALKGLERALKKASTVVAMHILSDWLGKSSEMMTPVMAD